MFGHAFQTNKTISTKKWNHQWTINIFIHFLTTESQGFMRFPHQYPPLRPRLSTSFASTAAFASRSRWTTESRPLKTAKCSGVLPREAAARGQATGRTPRNEKNLGTSKVEVWEIVATQKSSLDFRNIVVLHEDVLMTSSWLKELLPLAFWQSRCHG